MAGPLSYPQPGQVITGYQIFEPKVSLEVSVAASKPARCCRRTCHEVLECVLQTGCCQCENLSPTGWIAVILLLIIFWPLFWIPFVMPECYEVSHLVVLKSCPCTCHAKKHRRLQHEECPVSLLSALTPLALPVVPSHKP